MILFFRASRVHGEIVEPTVEETVLLKHNGDCSLSFSHFFKSTCEIDVSNFPFDSQICSLQFGSWSMDHRLLLLETTNKNATDDKYPPNGEWELRSATMFTLQVIILTVYREA